MIRVFRHYIPKSLVILGTCEFIILVVSVYLGVTLRFAGGFNPTDKLLVGSVWPKALLYGLLMFELWLRRATATATAQPSGS